MARTFWIGFGDIHGDISGVGRVPGIAEAAGVIISGDLTNHGGPAKVRAVLDAVRLHNPRVMAQIGNMDLPEADRYLSDEGVNIHRRGIELVPGVGLMGVGWSTPTPFGTPSEVGEDIMEAWLKETWKFINDCEHLILVCHTPPHGTAVDRIGSGIHVGSPAVRAFIEKAQPDVCLTGHIHESKAMDRIGRTVVVNPGPFAAGGYVVIEWDGGALTAELHTI